MFAVPATSWLQHTETSQRRVWLALRDKAKPPGFLPGADRPVTGPTGNYALGSGRSRIGRTVPARAAACSKPPSFHRISVSENFAVLNPNPPAGPRAHKGSARSPGIPRRAPVPPGLPLPAPAGPRGPIAPPSAWLPDGSRRRTSIPGFSTILSTLWPDLSRAFSFSQVAGESVRGEPVEPRVDGPAISSGLTWKAWVWRKMKRPCRFIHGWRRLGVSMAPRNWATVAERKCPTGVPRNDWSTSAETDYDRVANQVLKPALVLLERDHQVEEHCRKYPRQ